jgi:hypothetical protein
MLKRGFGFAKNYKGMKNTPLLLLFMSQKNKEMQFFVQI